MSALVAVGVMKSVGDSVSFTKIVVNAIIVDGTPSVIKTTCLVLVLILSLLLKGVSFENRDEIVAE